MRIFLVAIFLLVFSALQSQITCTGIIRSDVDYQPVSDVQISFSSGSLITTSDKEGKFKFKLKEKSGIVFSHVGFEDFFLTVKDSGEDLEILLVSSETRLPVANVNASLPEVVFKDEHYHAADYEFDSGNIFVLTYTKKRLMKSTEDTQKEILSECRVVLLDTALNVVNVSGFIEDGIELFQDEFNQTFLVCLKRVYFIESYNNQLLLSEIDYTSFNDGIKSVVYKDEELTILSNFDELFPEFSYFIHEEGNEEATELCRITDEELMHTFRAQWRDLRPREKLQAVRTEYSTGIDKEIVSGYMTGFHKSIYFKPPYAPLFSYDNQFVLFNLQKGSIGIYNRNGEMLRDTVFRGHLKPKANGWVNHILQDKTESNIFARYSINGFSKLSLIDLKTGVLESNFTLRYKYPEEIKIIDGYVYYLYRPFASSQKKYLYKEKIELD